tara:strand:- start:1404 stop:1709 length:306 start_codon:yes stop_codon:yes gene_type:complete
MATQLSKRQLLKALGYVGLAAGFMPLVKMENLLLDAKLHGHKLLSGMSATEYLESLHITEQNIRSEISKQFLLDQTTEIEGLIISKIEYALICTSMVSKGY